MSLAFPPPIDAVRRLAESHAATDPCSTALRGARLPMLVTAGQERDHQIVFVNEAFSALTGYAAEEALGRNPRFLQGPDTDPATVDAMRGALRDGREISVELLNYRKDGTPFWNGMFMSPVRASDGTITFWFASHLDISSRKTREHALVRSHGDLETAVAERTDHLRRTVEQKTLLLHEVEHRVKNNLQLITSLIQFQSRRTPDPTVHAALKQVQDRVSAVSTAHRRLFQTEDAGRFDVAQCLRDLVDDLVGRNDGSDLQLHFDLQDATAEAARAAPLALLVNELLTQLLQDILPSGAAGRLGVRLRSGPGRCIIELELKADSVEHAAGSLPDEPGAAAPSGFAGIVEILSRQLGAVVDRRSGPLGATAVILLPLESQ